MSLHMLGAAALKTPAKAAAKTPAASAPASRKSPTVQAPTQASSQAPAQSTSAQASSKAPPSVDSPADVAALAKELQKLGAQNKNHKNPKIAALAKKALTAAASLQVQGGGHAVGAVSSPSGKAAVALLQQLKAALADDQKQGQSKNDAAKAQALVAAAQTKLRASAQKMNASASKLKSKAQSSPKKGKFSQAVAARASNVASKLSGAGSKLLSLASKKVTPVVTASTARKVAIGDDLSDAQAQLAAAQQAYADAQAAAQGVSDDLSNARAARDAVSANDPTYDQVYADYDAAVAAAMSLIFSDTSLADAANALADAQALVAAIQGLPPPGSQPGAPQPTPPPPVQPTGGAAISPPSASIAAGATTKLLLQVGGKAPSPSTPVLWSSSNSQVASVDQTGLVTANGPGSANITAAQGSALAQAQVTVTGQLSASVSPPQMQLSIGQPGQQPLQFLVNGQPPVPNAALPVSWTSSNPTAVTVDQMGNVTAVAAGFAQITATRGTASAAAQVSVIDPNAQQTQMPGGGGGGGGGPSGGDDGGGGYGGGDEGYADDGGGDGGDAGPDEGGDDSDNGADGGGGDGGVQFTDAGDESVWDQGDDGGGEAVDNDGGDMLGVLQNRKVAMVRRSVYDEVDAPSYVMLVASNGVSTTFSTGIKRVVVANGYFWVPGWAKTHAVWDDSSGPLTPPHSGTPPTATVYFNDGSSKVFKNMVSVETHDGTVSHAHAVGCLHMLGALDTSIIPGILQTAGGALTGKPTPAQAQAQAQQAQAEAQKKQAADAAASSSKAKTAATWIVGGVLGLGVLGIVGALLRKVISK